MAAPRPAVLRVLTARHRSQLASVVLGVLALVMAARNVPGGAVAMADGTAASFTSYGIGVTPFGAKLVDRPGGERVIDAVPAGARFALGGRVIVPAGLTPIEAYWVAIVDGTDTVYGFLPARAVHVVAGAPPRLDLSGVALETLLSPDNAVRSAAALGAPVLPSGLDAVMGDGSDGVPEGGLAIAWLPETVRRWEALIVAAGRAHGVDPNLVAIIALVESGGDPGVHSPAGAAGLMQVMPGTAQDIVRARGMAALGADGLLDPAVNIDLGAWYLAQQLKAFGSADDPDWKASVALAAAAYNGGPGRVASYLRGGTLPAESSRYRDYVSGMWAERDAASSPTFERWLAAGGARLVSRAASAPGPGDA